MSNEWEYPDVADLIRQRDDIAVPMMPDQPTIGPIGQGHVIDPDYAEKLNIPFDDLVRNS
jgi:hypothetical protein